MLAGLYPSAASLTRRLRLGLSSWPGGRDDSHNRSEDEAEHHARVRWANALAIRLMG
jgi:hypothetical protein